MSQLGTFSSVDAALRLCHLLARKQEKPLGPESTSPRKRRSTGSVEASRELQFLQRRQAPLLQCYPAQHRPLPDTIPTPYLHEPARGVSFGREAARRIFCIASHFAGVHR